MTQTFVKYFPLLLKGTGETLYMVLISTILAYLLGIPLGVLIYQSRQGGIRPNRTLNTVLGAVINIVRSIPFIILILYVTPLTKALLNTIIGPNAAILALVIAAAPFVARMVESSLEELDVGVIEAARTMGATDFQIITKVLLPESVPSLIRGLSITTITLIGYSAMAGTVGAGGLGDIAIRFGYHRFQPEVMNATLLLIILIVQVIQMGLGFVARRIDKRTR